MKVLFVHIPKTAGVSIRRFLVANNLENWVRMPFLRHHDPFFLLEENNNLDDTFVFTVVRNPYTRAFSHYNYIKELFDPSFDFTEFLKYIKFKGNNFFNVRFLKKEHIPFLGIKPFLKKRPLIFYDQTFFTHNKENKVGVQKIYKFENLVEFENDFDIKLRRTNVGNYTKESFFDAYTEENINLVRYLYCNDFINFNYSTDIKDSFNT